MFYDDPSDSLLMRLTRLLGWGNEGFETQCSAASISTTTVFPGWELPNVMTKKVKSSNTILT